MRLLVLGLFLGFAASAPYFQGPVQRNLASLLIDIYDELDLGSILPTLKQKFRVDPQGQRIIAYLKGAEFKAIVDHLRKCPEYKNLKLELLKEGINVDALVDSFHQLDFDTNYVPSPFPQGALSDFLNDVLAHFDIPKIINVLKDKMENDEDMKKLVSLLGSSDMKGLIECMKSSQELKNLKETLLSEGINVVEIVNGFKGLLAMDLKVPEPLLIINLLEDLISELGLADLLPWFKEQIDNDPDAQRIVEYLRGPTFERILNHLRQCPGYIAVKEDLLLEGVDLVEILEKVRNFLSGKTTYTTPNQRALGDLLNELLSKLDINTVINIMKDKLENDPDMKKIANFLHSQQFKDIVDCMRGSPDVQELLAKLKEEGIDVKKIIELVKNLFVNDYRTSNSAKPKKIVDLIHDLIDKLGIMDLLPWLLEKIHNDPEAAKVIQYLKGPDFNKILEQIKNCPGYPEIRDQLKDEGIDLVEIVRLMRDLLAGINPEDRRSSRKLGDLLEEFLSKLDIAEIAFIISDKIDNDPDMKKLIQIIKSDNAAKIVACMKESKELKTILNKLKDEGVDVWKLYDMIKNLLGAPSRSIASRTIKDLIHDLVDELGLLDLLPWFIEKIQTDPDAQRVIEYLKGKEFEKIIETLKNCPGYPKLKEQLKNEGIDLVHLLEVARDILSGINPSRRQVRASLGDLLDELLSKLDLGSLISIIKDKLDNDPDMAKLLAMIKSDEAKQVVACMKASPEVQDLLAKLKKEGIDVLKLYEMVKNLLGVEIDTYSFQSRTIKDLIHDLVDELGLLDLLPWFIEKIQNDPDAQRVIEYLKGKEFAKIIETLKNCPGYPKLKEQLKNEGIDLVHLLEVARDILSGINPSRRQVRASLGDLLDELLSKLDLGSLISIIKDKLDNDPDMAKLLAMIKSDEAKQVVACMKASPEVQDLLAKLKKEGIDVLKLYEMVKNLLGVEIDTYSFQSRTIKDLIHDLVDELGLLDLLPWFIEKIQNDPDAQRVIEYLKGKEFAKIIETLKNCPGYPKLKEQLKNEGIDLVHLLEVARDILSGINPSRRQVRASLGDLLDELLSKLDLGSLISIIKDKLDNDPDMAKLLAMIKSDEAKQVVACMKASPEVQDLLAKLKKEGIDVLKLYEMVKNLLGVEIDTYSFQSRTIKDLIHDLVDELGLLDLLPWFIEKIQTDPDAQRVIEYLKGKEFEKIIETLKNCPGYPKLKEQLKNEGIDLVHLLEVARDILSGINPSRRQVRASLGDLLDELLSKLDLGSLISIIKDKLDNDPDMAKLLAMIKSDEAKQVVACMKASPEVQDLLAKLKKEGIDVLKLYEMVKNLLGVEIDMYSFQSRTIKDLIHDLVDELGLLDLLPWFIEKIQTDPDAQRVIEYLKGKEFEKIIETLKNCPGYPKLKEQLKNEGIDLVHLLEVARDILSGINPSRRQVRASLGDLLDELLSKLDLGSLISIIKDKLDNDPDMAKLLAMIKSDEAKQVVACMKASPEVQDLVAKLKKEGIDVLKLYEMVKNLLGVEIDMYSFQSRTIKDLIHDLVDELGLLDLLPWFIEKIQNDPDAQRVIEYLKGKEFEKIIETLKNCPGYPKLKEQLKNEGIDLVHLLEVARDILSGINPSRRQVRASLGDLLDELLSKLDLGSLISIIKDKLDNDPDMAKLLAMIKSDEAKQVVACMKASPEVQDLLAKLKKEGIDVLKLYEMVKNLLGVEIDMYSFQSRTIKDLIHDLVDELGLLDLLPWFIEKIQNDPDAQRVIEYLNGKEFEKIIETLKNCPGYPKLKEQLKNEGIDLVHLLEVARDILSGINPSRRQVRASLGDLLDELLSKLDLGSLISIIKDKLDNDPDMAKLLAMIKSDEAKQVVACMKASPEVQDLVAKLKKEGIDVLKLYEMVKNLLGVEIDMYSFQSRTIKDLIHDLVDELGLLDLLPWFIEKIQNDPDAQRVIEYLKGKEFEKIIETLKNCPGYPTLKLKLKEEGIDLVELLKKARDILAGINPRGPSTRGTLGDLLNELLSKLDLGAMISIIKDKMDNDPSMAKVIELVKSQEAKQVVSCMMSKPEVQNLLNKLKAEGIDVLKLAEMIQSLLGIELTSFRSEPRKVIDLIHDLIEETGIADLLPWFEEQVKNDADVQRIIAYLKSEHFKKVVEHLKGCPAYQATKEKLQAEGVDLVNILQKVRDWLAGVEVSRGVSPRRTLGELIDEFLSKLDMNIIIAVFREKIANDPDMQKVLNFVKGPEPKNIVECLRQSTEFNELVQKLKAEGVDLHKMVDLIKVALGLE